MTQPSPRRRLLPIILFSIAAVCSAQLLFPSIPDGGQVVLGLEHDVTNTLSTRIGPTKGPLWTGKGGKIPKVAIIGAGAAGSSAAYFLAHFRNLEDLGLKTEVTIYESSEYIGGRSTVVRPWNDDPYQDRPDEDTDAVELGASIFVDANKNLKKASKLFNLPLKGFDTEEGTTGIWDGTSFVYEEPTTRTGGWWNLAKMWWRYGRSPLYVRDLVKETVDSFLTLYQAKFHKYGPFEDLFEFIPRANFSLPISLTGADYFKAKRINERFTNELSAAASQVNYGQEIGSIHGVGAMVSLAAEGSWTVIGGNRRIFENFVAESESKLRLGDNARVQSIEELKTADGGRKKWTVTTVTGAAEDYDAVILAAPFHQANISVKPSSISTLIPEQAYVALHVSFIITNSSAPQPSYFSQPANKKMHNSIFSTFSTSTEPKPAFNSLNYMKQLPTSIGSRFGEGEWHVIKMFSKETLEMDLLEEIYGKGNVGKSWEKVWNAYPVLEPVLFQDQLAKVRVGEGFYYVNGFERLISTMETETVASYNIVSLLLKDFYDYSPPTSWAEWDD